MSHHVNGLQRLDPAQSERSAISRTQMHSHNSPNNGFCHGIRDSRSRIGHESARRSSREAPMCPTAQHDVHKQQAIRRIERDPAHFPRLACLERTTRFPRAAAVGMAVQSSSNYLQTIPGKNVHVPGIGRTSRLPEKCSSLAAWAASPGTASSSWRPSPSSEGCDMLELIAHAP